VKPLQYFCSSLSVSLITQQRKLHFWKKIYWSDNIGLLTLSRLTYNAFVAVGCTFSVLTPKLCYQTVQSKDSCGTHLQRL